jgi:hypothetical protein
MQAWAKDQQIEGSMITFLADTRGEFTSAIGMFMDHPGPKDALGNTRCKRFVLICQDGVVKHVEVSEAPNDPAGDNEPNGPITAKTRVEHVLELLSERSDDCPPPKSVVVAKDQESDKHYFTNGSPAPAPDGSVNVPKKTDANAECQKPGGG